MVKYILGIPIPDNLKEPVVHNCSNGIVLNEIKPYRKEDGSIQKIDYYQAGEIVKRVIYSDSDVSEIQHFQDEKLKVKQLFDEGVLKSEYYYKPTGELNYYLVYEYKLDKISAIEQSIGLSKRRVEFKYDFMGRISERTIYSDKKSKIAQRYFYDAMDRINGYEDGSYQLFVEKFTQDNKLLTYKITDKIKNEIVINNKYIGNVYKETSISVNGEETIRKDINYVDNIMTKKPTNNIDDLDLIIAGLYNDKQQESSITTRRDSAELENRLDSNLVNIIEYKSKVRPLPIALRKRVMYQRSLESHG